MGIFFRLKYIKRYRSTYSFFFLMLFISGWKSTWASSPLLEKELSQQKKEGLLTTEQYDYIIDLLSNLQSLKDVCAELRKTPTTKYTLEDLCAPYAKAPPTKQPFRIKTTHLWVPEKKQQDHLFYTSFQHTFFSTAETRLSSHSTFQINQLRQYHLSLEHSKLQIEMGKIKPLPNAPFLIGRSFWSRQKTVPLYHGFISPNTPYLNGLALSYGTPSKKESNKGWKVKWWSTRNQTLFSKGTRLNSYLYGMQMQHTSPLWYLHTQSLWQQYQFSKSSGCNNCVSSSHASLWLQSLYIQEYWWKALEFRMGWVLYSSLADYSSYPSFGWVRWKSNSLPIQTTLYQTSPTWQNPLMGTFSRSSFVSPQGITVYGPNEGSLHTKFTDSRIKAEILYHWVQRESQTYSLFARHRIQLQKITFPPVNPSLFSVAYTHIQSDSTQYWSTQLKHQYSFSHSKLQSALTFKSASYSGSYPLPAYIKWNTLFSKKKSSISTLFPKTSVRWNTSNLASPFKIWDIQMWQSWSFSKGSKASLQSYLELPFEREELQAELFYKLNLVWQM